MAIWLQHVKGSFLEAVDADKVQPFQVVVYAGVLLSGLYMTAFGTPTAVREQLGGGMHYVWIGCTLVGPLMMRIGDGLINWGKHEILKDERPGGGARVYWGWYLQLGGDFIVLMAFITYVIAAFNSSWLSKGMFAAFIVLSLSVCALILVFRDSRRIRAIERL